MKKKGESAVLDKSLINRVYFVGIKGTGMSALAELMLQGGYEVSGSDRDEVFYTDAVLKNLGIPFYESFEAAHVLANMPDLIIYSPAYSADFNAEIAEGQRLGIPLLSYPEALGAYSSNYDSSGIAGVHGKTTTTAIAGALLRGVGVPAQILAGTAAFDGRSTLNLGEKYFVAETCEYRRHFLSFHPQRIILTSVESDHQDYYPRYKDIWEAFLEYGRLLPSGGELIYCADNKGASDVAGALGGERQDIKLIPYGFSAEGDFAIDMYKAKEEQIVFKVRAFPGELKMRVPGRHSALNATAAIALCSSLVKKEFGNDEGWDEERQEALRNSLEKFSGSKRRSEILGEAGGILFMDDYGHHPTAIKTTLEGLKDFYPRRRLVLSFMSHTYTRTASLLDEFALSFEMADLILLHKIYSSAREAYSGGVTGRTLFEKAHDANPHKPCYYVEESEDASDLMKGILKSGDLFITMGAGDNWKLGEKLFKYYSGRENK